MTEGLQPWADDTDRLKQVLILLDANYHARRGLNDQQIIESLSSEKGLSPQDVHQALAAYARPQASTIREETLKHTLLVPFYRRNDQVWQAVSYTQATLDLFGITFDFGGSSTPLRFEYDEVEEWSKGVMRDPALADPRVPKSWGVREWNFVWFRLKSDKRTLGLIPPHQLHLEPWFSSLLLWIQRRMVEYKNWLKFKQHLFGLCRSRGRLRLAEVVQEFMDWGGGLADLDGNGVFPSYLGRFKMLDPVATAKHFVVGAITQWITDGQLEGFYDEQTEEYLATVKAKLEKAQPAQYTIVHGDMLGPGAKKLQDSVEISKPPIGPPPAQMGPQTAGETKAFAICPYCGQELSLPETPRFCPYCRKQLQR